MATATQVTDINRYRTSKIEGYYGDYIETFLEMKGSKSYLTAASYRSDIEQFLNMVVGKSIGNVTSGDMYAITNIHIVKYQSGLLAVKDEDDSQYYENTTINRKMNTISELAKFLSRSDSNIRPESFKVDRLWENPNSYGILDWEEVKTMIGLAMEEDEKPLEKSLMVELAAVTSFRLDTLVNLKWDQFTQHQDGYYVIEVVGKKKKIDKKPIRAELYAELQRLVEVNGEEKVFSLSGRTFQRVIKRLSDKMKIAESRNIVFHSLKKTAINWIIDVTGDMRKGAVQGNHSNIQTTYRNYADKNIDMSEMAGLNIYNDVDLSLLSELSKEQLIDLIANSSTAVKIAISNSAKSLVNA